MRIHRSLLAALAFAVAAAPALAQDAYPARPIRLIVPYTPGTGADILARVLGQKIGERGGKWSLVVDNRPGASGNIGTEAVAKAAPDGYTLMVTASTLVTNVGLFKNLPYDPIKDFAPVAPLAVGRLALVVNPAVPAQTAAELITLAKAAPKKYTYGSPGNGTPHHLACELFAHNAGIALVHIPYKGTAGAVTDLLSGQIDLMFLPVHVAQPQVQAGKLRMLAAGGVERSAVTPNVPSLAEATGVRDIDVDIWYAVYAPAGTPAAIVAKLNEEFNAALKSPDIADTLAKQGLQPTGGTPADLARTTATDLPRWAATIKAANIQPD